LGKPAPVSGDFSIGESVDAAPDTLDYFGNLTWCWSFLSSLKEQVLEQVRSACKLRSLVSRSCPEEEDDAYSVRVAEGGSEDSEPVGKDGALKRARYKVLRFCKCQTAGLSTATKK
jgi:hypothetical protein